MKSLKLGKLSGHDYFELPLDAATHTFAVVGQRGSGKSSGGMVMAAEMCEAGIPWAAIDRVGNWRGLKSKKDGSKGYPIVVFGGKTPDLEFQPLQGAMIAEAVARSGITVVIDCYGVDLQNQQLFVRDFCRSLEKIEPERSTHVFFEEAAEYAPQSPADKIAKQCHDAVASLFLLGRNWGYGATALLQRPADVSKKVLSQCETLLVMRTSGSHDRKALKDWMSGHGEPKDILKTIGALANLEDGSGYVWSPRYLGLVSKFKFRERETFHPGETRKAHVAKPVDLQAADVSDFVQRLRKELSKTQAVVPENRRKQDLTADLEKMKIHPPYEEKRRVEHREYENLLSEHQKLEARFLELEKSVNGEKASRKRADERLSKVRGALEPLWKSMKILFEETEPEAEGGVDRGHFQLWIDKAPKDGIRVMLENLLDRGSMTIQQLCTVAGVKKSTGHQYVSWLKRNQLVEKKDKKYEIRRT